MTEVTNIVYFPAKYLNLMSLGYGTMGFVESEVTYGRY